MAFLDFQRVVGGLCGVEGAVEREPVVIGRARIDVWTCGRRLIWCRAGRNLVEVLGDAQAVSVHADITDTQAVVSGELTFDREVPLIRLRVAVVRINPLIKAAPAKLYSDRRWRRVGKLNERRGCCTAVGISVQR